MVVAGRSWGLPSLHYTLGPVCNSYQLFHLCVVAAAACLLVLEQCCLGGYTESMTGRSQELPSLRCMCQNDGNPGAFILVSLQPSLVPPVHGGGRAGALQGRAHSTDLEGRNRPLRAWWRQPTVFGNLSNAASVTIVLR